VRADFAPFERKMRDAGLPEVAVRSFRFAYAQLASGGTGTLSRREIAPVEVAARADDLEASRAAGSEAMERTVVVKLNGGLGTSMGMTRAKSLLPLKGDLTFLDVIARQLVHLREHHGHEVPLVLMNSFRTRSDSLRHLERYGRLSGPLPPDFLQHKVPRIRVADLAPVEWPADPEQEWCPPGHGDIYAALLSSGMLDAMLDAGYRTAFVSNSDNLGAVLDPAILGFFVASGAPFAMEVKERTEIDRKGGHLARLRDGRLVLREIAQCPDDELRDYEDVKVWRLFNTNNLWLDLPALKRTLDERNGVLGLPLIRNEKTVDPRDPATPRVIQLETAMGAAISVFEGAQAIRVPEERFAPVKTTSDLLRVRSDAYVLSEDGRLLPATPTAARIAIDLDSGFFRTIDQLDLRFPKGAPSLVACRSLRVRGDVRFGAEVVVRGDVTLEAEQGVHRVPDGALLEG
jgi:UTP--glucose-1-phosphate uridylyltransferase